MRTELLATVFAVAAIAAGGCKKDGGDRGGSGAASGSGSGSATASGSGSDAPLGEVRVFVNEAPIATIEAAQLQTWPRLDTLVPEADRRLGTWVGVTIVGAKTTELQRPSSAYPDKVPVVFPGDGGTASFGMFDPVELAKKGPPGLRADDVREIRITLSAEGRGGDHQGGAGGDVDPTKLVLTFQTPAGTRTLSGTDIIALPREEVDQQPGWKLTTLLAAVGIKDYQRLVLLDAGGTSLVLDRKDFDDTTKIPFVKLNKQGQLRFRVYARRGEGWQASGDLRALATVQIK